MSVRSCILGVGLVLASLAGAQEAPVAERLAALEAIVRDQATRLAANEVELSRLRARVAELEGDPTNEPIPETDAPDPTRRRRVDIESSRRGFEHVRLGGRLETEYVDSEYERDSPAGGQLIDQGQFQIDKARVALEIVPIEALRALVEIDVEGDGGVDLGDAFVELEGLPLKGEVSVGRQRRFFALDRRLESYPLAGAAFWRARDVGIQGQATLGAFTGHVSLANGLELGRGRVSEDAGFLGVVGRGTNRDLATPKELALGLEVDVPLATFGALEVMAFTAFGRLSDPELAFLAELEPPTPSRDRDASFHGLNVDLDLGGFEVQAQVISADEGAELDRLAWYVQPSWAFDLPGVELLGDRFFTGVRLLGRVGELRNDLAARPDDSATWNRSAWTLGAAVDLARHTELIIEHTWNRESPGRFAVDNDELILHLRLSW